jgi:hypothetical protein
MSAHAESAIKRVRSNTEQRARTTTAVLARTAQNGTSGVLAYGKHAWRGAAGATPRTGVRGYLNVPSGLPNRPSVS